jgi:hypothetical protein
MRTTRNLLKVLLSLLILLPQGLRADEGMWMPQLLRQLNAAEMRIKGLQIPVEEIYSVNKNSLKDAVVLFGGGCTGEIISDKGLLLTNHHCGYGQIQEHSSLEHNYLRDGFWAKSEKEELACPGLTATFIIRIDDVTAEFRELDNLSESQRNEKIKSISSALEKKAVEGTHYEARVRQFYNGNEFYLIVTETFRDVRLVGAPPSSIGKFGGDTDNWMWPRHTGDFSLFRVYSGPDNKPADYSEKNVPFKPRHFFSISLKGVQPEDFTMVYGFPGRTQQYISSYQLETILEVTNPNRIRIRDERLRIMDEAMRSSELLHIQYAAKQSGVSNAWKKWKGETRGLLAADALQKKRYFEADFKVWIEKEESRKTKYGMVLPSLQNLYASNKPYLSANDYYSEAAFGIELFGFCNSFTELILMAGDDKPDQEAVKKEVEHMKLAVADYFKDYDAPTDRKMMESRLVLFLKSVADSLKPAHYLDQRTRYKSDFSRMAGDLFARSLFDEKSRVEKVLDGFDAADARSLRKDPAWQLANELTTFYRTRIAEKVQSVSASLARLNRLYMAAQREMQPERKFYPDANSTLRVAFGQVRGYEARDAVSYGYYTTLDGIMEKYRPGDEEFDLPASLIDLYRRKDYGRYAVNGTIPVAFVATNHTTGGNSGSPVLNARGHLIGTNYDRVWEGTMSDILFNPEICRNITLDVRYTLFVVDKVGGANWLIDEMDIVE